MRRENRQTSRWNHVAPSAEHRTTMHITRVICILAFNLRWPPLARNCYLGLLNRRSLFRFRPASAANGRNMISVPARQCTSLELPTCVRRHWQEPANLPRRGGYVFFFSFRITYAIIGLDMITYPGTFGNKCLFSFQLASATIGRHQPPLAGLCYLGALNSICLFSFQLALATIGRRQPPWPDYAI